MLAQEILTLAGGARRRFWKLHAAMAMWTVAAVDRHVPAPYRETVKGLLRLMRDAVLLPPRMMKHAFRAGIRASRIVRNRIARGSTTVKQVKIAAGHAMKSRSLEGLRNLPGVLQYVPFESMLQHLRNDAAFPLSLQYDATRHELIAICDVGAPPHIGRTSEREEFLSWTGRHPFSRVVVRYRDRWDLLPCPFDRQAKPNGDDFLELEMPCATLRPFGRPALVVNDLLGARTRPIHFYVLDDQSRRRVQEGGSAELAQPQFNRAGDAPP